MAVVLHDAQYDYMLPAEQSAASQIDLAQQNRGLRLRPDYFWGKFGPYTADTIMYSESIKHGFAKQPTAGPNIYDRVTLPEQLKMARPPVETIAKVAKQIDSQRPNNYSLTARLGATPSYLTTDNYSFRDHIFKRYRFKSTGEAYAAPGKMYMSDPASEAPGQRTRAPGWLGHKKPQTKEELVNWVYMGDMRQNTELNAAPLKQYLGQKRYTTPHDVTPYYG